MVAKGEMKPNMNDPNTWPNIAPTPPAPQSQPSQPSGQGNAIRPGPLPRNAGQFDPSINVGGWINPEQNQGDTAVYGPAPVPGQAGYIPQPGTEIYDQFAINDLLRQSGMNGFQAAGSYIPIEITETKQDDLGNYQQIKTGYYLINVTGPNGEIRQLKLAKVANPDGSGRYGWSLQNVTRTIDPQDRKRGYSGQMTIGGRLYGTNEETGVFELVPGAPEIPQGWSNMLQVTEQDGSKRWYGVDPKDPGAPPKPVPGMPTVPATPGYTNPQWLKDPGGQSQSLWGYNNTTNQLEKVPGSPSQPVETQPIALGNIVYRKKPDGTLEVDPNVQQAREGNERYVPYTGQPGYAKKQRFTNGDWQDAVGDPEYLKPVGPEAQALPPKGTPVRVAVQGQPGKFITGIANGIGGVDLPPPGSPIQVENVPGLATPETVSGAGTSEFMPSRRDPVTQQLLPPERNPNWQPSLFADRVRQLQQQAYAKRDELHARVGQAGYTNEQADADFKQFWDQSIKPAYDQLQSDQQTALVTQATARNQELRAQANQRQSQYANAVTLGQVAVNNAIEQNKNRVGPGFGEYAQKLLGAISQGKAAPPPNVSDFTYNAPDYNKMSQYYTAQALRYISPTAANMVGSEPTLPAAAQGLDLTGMFNQTRFMPSAAPPMPTPVAAGGTAPTVNVNVSTQPQPQPIPNVPVGYKPDITPLPNVPIGYQPNLEPASWAPTQSWSGMPLTFGQFQYPG